MHGRLSMVQVLYHACQIGPTLPHYCIDAWHTVRTWEAAHGIPCHGIKSFLFLIFYLCSVFRPFCVPAI
jgi:hypothetical protein